jgi:aminoglycoside phosphotransferase (APT) family kinase protein
VLSTARDVSREWRFVSALAPTAVPVPQPVAYCAGHAGAGAEWRVPAQASGIVHGDYRTGNVAFGQTMRFGPSLTGSS